MAAYDYIDGDDNLSIQDEAINDALNLVGSMHLGSSAPSSTYAGQNWVDTSSGREPWKVRDSGDAAWKTVYNLGTDCGPVIDTGTYQLAFSWDTPAESFEIHYPGGAPSSGESLRVASIGSGVAVLEWFTAAGGVTTLGTVTDVDVTTNPPSDGQVLIYDADGAAGAKWIPGTVSGGGGSSTLDDLDNVAITGPLTTGDILRYNGTNFVAVVGTDHFAAASHSHAATDITSGTLTVARGGTGATSFPAGQVLLGAGGSAITSTPAANLLTSAVLSSGDEMTGDLQLTGSDLILADDDGSAAVTIEVPSVIQASYTLTLPDQFHAGTGSDKYALEFDIAGQASWIQKTAFFNLADLGDVVTTTDEGPNPDDFIRYNSGTLAWENYQLAAADVNTALGYTAANAASIPANYLTNDADDTMAGTLTLEGIRLDETTAGTDYIEIVAATGEISTSYTIAIPTTAPTANQVLEHVGSGVYAWIDTPAGGGGGGDPDQNLWHFISGDSGTDAAPASVTDTLNIVGSGFISTAISAGDTVTISGTLASSDIPTTLNNARIFTGNITLEDGANIVLEDDDGSAAVSLTAASAMTGSYSIEFPAAGPASDAVRKATFTGQMDGTALVTFDKEPDKFAATFLGNSGEIPVGRMKRDGTVTALYALCVGGTSADVNFSYGSGKTDVVSGDHTATAGTSYGSATLTNTSPSSGDVIYATVASVSGDVDSISLILEVEYD